MGKLNQLQVKSAKPGRHGDGDGLYLLVSAAGAKSWVLRVQAEGRRRDVGLGAVDTMRGSIDRSETAELPLLLRRRLTLAEAREKASLLRSFAKAGRDPIAERDKERRKVPTFKEAAIIAHSELAPGWAKKHGDAFLASLEDHAYRTLGNIRVDEIEASHIRDMLSPIWTDIPVMARKVRQRASTVLTFAKSKGWRATEAPGKSVTMGLARHRSGGHFEAMPYVDVPQFVAKLRAKPKSAGRVALLLLIYTAARTGEVRSTKRGHFDFARREWNRPAEIMKGRIAHTVSLSDAVVEILSRWFHEHPGRHEDLVFAGKGGAMLSDMTLTKSLRDAGETCTVHGFRSSFRDWAAEKMPLIPDPVAEAALAHVVPDKVIAAYKRTNFSDLRRDLLDAWSSFLT